MISKGVDVTWSIKALTPGGCGYHQPVVHGQPACLGAQPTASTYRIRRLFHLDLHLDALWAPCMLLGTCL